MSLWSRLFAPMEAKASSIGSMVSTYALGRAAFKDRSPKALAFEGYRQGIIAYACIRLIADAVADLVADADLYQTARSGEDTEIEDDPILDLLARPNPDQDAHDYFADLLTWRLIAGNAYSERIDGVGGMPQELWNLRADRMSVIPGPDGRAVAYDYTVNQQTRRLPRYQGNRLMVLHLKAPNPLDDWYGMSALDPAGFSADVHTGASALLKALIDNSARPSGALSYTGDVPLTQDQRLSLREQIDSAWVGAKNAGKPLLLDGGLKWEQIGMSIADMQMMDLRNDMARDICRAFKVPPMLMGIPGDNTFANYQEANKALYRDCVMPLAGQVCRAFSRWLLPPNQYLAIDEDDIPALADERAAKWTQIQNADFLTINEKREALGYEAIEGGEVLLVPTTMTPVAEVGLMPEGGAGASVADDAMDEEDDDA